MAGRIRAAVYARYSSHSQTEQSIEGQVHAAEELCRRKGYELVEQYCDRAKTGRNDNREAFQRMLKESAKRRWQVLIVWKVDRIGRNREEIAINKYRLRKNGVTVEYAAENLPDTPEGVILESVLEGMAEYYSLQLSQNIRRGIKESAMKGKRNGGQVALGYKRGEDGKPVIDERTAPAVRYAYEHYAAGETEAEIIRALNEKGYRTARGREFQRTSLRTVLKNPAYKGLFTALDGEVVIEGGCPPIVSEELWDRVQAARASGAARRGSERVGRHDFILTGKLFCGHCGRPMTGITGTSHTGARHMYYTCHGRKTHSGCQKRNEPCQYVEELVIRETLELLKDDAVVDEIVRAVYAYYEQTDTETDDLEGLRAGIQDAQRRRANLIRSLEQGAPYDVLAPRMKELEDEEASLLSELDRLEALASERLTEDHIRFFIERFRDMDHSDRKVQRLLVHTFVNAVYLYDDGPVKIVYNFSEHTEVVPLSEVDGLGDPTVRLEASVLHFRAHRRTIMYRGCAYVILLISRHRTN